MSPFTILFSFSHIFLLLLLQLASFATAQPVFYAQYCSDRLNYTTNSTYRRNLNSLLSSFASDTEITDGFYNLSVGNTPNKVNGIALCRGDIKLQECRKCIYNSTVKILQVCPNQIESFGYYDLCMLRFTNRSIFGVVDQGSIPPYYMMNPNNVPSSELDQFNQVLQSLLLTLRSKAAAGNSTMKFATGSENSGFYTIYGLMQCTPDLSAHGCDYCLGQSVLEIPVQMPGKIGGRVVKLSCNLRFETSLFYEITSSTISPVDPPSPPQGKNKRTIIIIVVSILSVLLAIVTCIIIYLRSVERTSTRIPTMDEISVESFKLDFETIRASTDGFSEKNKLGAGGFGLVYKGTLGDGEYIAVKRLSSNSRQGDIEFNNEISALAKLHHRNLVKFNGFCLEGSERLLIYEFLPNGNLDEYLFDREKSVRLDWEKRSKIIRGIAKGLLYLHEGSQNPIIHRDLKASNVLLDAEMNPKISDFGLARLFILDQTHITTDRHAGTFGYMAPEYAMHGHFSVKLDVFSFGVLILEIVSGRKNSSFRYEEDLLSYAWRNWREGTYTDIIDPNLRNGSTSEIMRCVHIGLLCVQENVSERPTMANVVSFLNIYSLTLSVPSQPYSPSSRVTHCLQSNVDEILPLSRNDVSITELHPR